MRLRRRKRAPTPAESTVAAEASAVDLSIDNDWVYSETHDAWVYAQTVEYEQCRIVLHTLSPHLEPWKYTDVVFEGVVVFHLDEGLVRADGKHPANVLFGISEAADPLFVLGPYEERLRLSRWWPGFEFKGPDELVRTLTAQGARCFEVDGTWGLHGFVFARSMELRARTSRAEVDTGTDQRISSLS